MKTRSAATVLSLQLAVPSMSGSDCRAVLNALGTLGGKRQVPVVRSFFSSFKNGGGDRAMLEALVLAAKFLLQFGTEEDRLLLETAKTDVLTHPDLAKSLEGLPLAPPAAPEKPQPSAPAKGKPRSTAP